MPRLLAPFVLLLALLAATALVACGDDKASSDDPAAVLKDTFGESRSIKSGKLDVGLNLDLTGIEGLQGPVKLVLKGPFSSNGAKKLPNFDFALDVNAGGQSFTAGAVSTGDAGYLELQGQAFDIGKELYEQFRKGYEQAQSKSDSEEEQGPTFASLGIDPLRWLTKPQNAGTEKVGGTETIHVRAGVDVEKFLADVSRLLDRAEGLEIEGAGKVPGGLTAKQREQVTGAVKSARVDVFTGKDDRTLRRLALAVDLDVPEATRKSVGGLRSGTIAFSVTIGDLNEEQTVSAPRNARPLSDLTAALQGLGVGGEATGADGTADGEGDTQSGDGIQPPPANAPQEYLDCLQRAGSDVAKIQACAQFLDG